MGCVSNVSLASEADSLMTGILKRPEIALYDPDWSS